MNRVVNRERKDVEVDLNKIMAAMAKALDSLDKM